MMEIKRLSRELFSDIFDDVDISEELGEDVISDMEQLDIDEVSDEDLDMEVFDDEYDDLDMEVLEDEDE